MPKRVLIFSTAYFPFVGGAEVAIKELVGRMPDIEFDLVTARLQSGFDNKEVKKEEKIWNVTVHRIGFGVSFLDKLLLPFCGAVKAVSLNNKNHYSAYWCVMVSFASGAAYIANIFSKNKVPIVLTLQEGDSESHLTYRWFGLLNLSWRLALKYASAVTAISSYLRERAKRLGCRKEIEIIPNGVDVGKFETQDLKREIREEVRKNLGLTENNVALITVSRLVKKNGVEDIIKSLKSLPEDIKLVILGKGELERNLKLVVGNLGLEYRVVFRGFVPNNELPKYLKAGDIFIRPSLSEGMGNSFIEAMAANLPVIATPVGGIPDFLKDGETGLFCKVNDPKSIADEVTEYVNNPELTEKIIENARQMVKEKYDWDKIAPKMKKVFEDLILKNG